MPVEWEVHSSATTASVGAPRANRVVRVHRVRACLVLGAFAFATMMMTTDFGSCDSFT